MGFFSKIANVFRSGGGGGGADSARAEAERELDRNLSCEEMDSDDLGGDLNLSDQEGGEEERCVRRQVMTSKRAVK